MLYPFIFKPILKSIIWGGSDICRFKGITPIQEGIGESWEISHVEDNYSVVANGELEGQSLDDLIRTYGARLSGEKVIDRFGETFPLLIKFIDARDDLSIQVHPDDKLAMERHHSFGKTEMWYVMQAAPQAKLLSGFSQSIDKDEYVKRVEENTLMEVLQSYAVAPGDVFFLPAGRVHAIGAGCFIAEIQQTSNITYRIYDYNRKDAAGNERELHTALAKDAIDYTWYPDTKTHYKATTNETVPLAECPYFVTNLLDLDTQMQREVAIHDSFFIYICMEGTVVLKDNNGYELLLHQGQTALIPAETQTITIIPSPHAKLMETYIPDR